VRAVRCEVYGPPSRIVVRDLPDPRPRPGQVVVDVAAASVNYPDVLTIADRYQISTPVPFTPGSEFAGRVAAVGDGVTGLTVGEPVMGSTYAGAMAEKVVVPSEALTRVPKGLDMVHAAAFRVTYLTAFHALVTYGGLQPGQWVVVLGAAGGVGSAAVDIAARLGARVLAAASSEDRVELARDLGAQETIDYGRENLKDRIKEITGGGADLVLDPVGGSLAEPALRAIRWGGFFVSIGFASGEIPRIPLNLVLLKNVVVRGMELRSVNERMPEVAEAAWRALEDLAAAGMKPTVSEVFDLEDAAVALERVAERKALGKIVVTTPLGRPSPPAP
jgi:NADPH:quinone reductase